MKKRRPRPALPAPVTAARLLVRLPSAQVGLFRFLLEAYDHLAVFTVLDRREALLKLIYSPHEDDRVRQALTHMSEMLDLDIHPWPQTR